MIIPLFPINIYKTSIDVDWNQAQVMARLDTYFDQQSADGTVVRNLHKEKVFEPIVKFMDAVVADYWDILGYDQSYPIGISQMWANKYERNAAYPHNLDNDSPSIVTCVFYVGKESAEQGNLFFADPNELVIRTQPLGYNRKFTNRYPEFDGRTGDLLCFPSWLQHGIQPNNTDIPRYSVACNYQLRGLDILKKALRS